MVRAFDALKLSDKNWDVTADRSTNQFAERTLANRAVNRLPVAFEFGSTDLIQFSARAMCFENVNGDDILIYPGLAVIPRADGVFALIDIWELQVTVDGVRFHENGDIWWQPVGHSIGLVFIEKFPVDTVKDTVTILPKFILCCDHLHQTGRASQ